jgi:hypothetical protein
MDDERARDFWERALGDIQDDGFFAPVRTAEPPAPPPPVRIRKRRGLSNIQLVLIVVVISLILALIIVSWLAPALF